MARHINRSDIDQRIAQSKAYLIQLEKAKEELEKTEFKQGQPVYHSRFKIGVILTLDYMDRENCNVSENGIFARIVHSRADLNENGDYTQLVPIHELLPYNESTRALYE